MAFRIEFTLLKPRIWLLSAAMLWVGAVCLYYYQAQMDATRTLAMMLGLPEPVAVQDFHKMHDSNHMSEVQLMAHVRMSDTRPVAGAQDPQLYMIPLYSTTEALAAGSSLAPFGFFVTDREAKEEGLMAFGLEEIAETGGGALVKALGTRIHGQSNLADTPYDLVPADLGLESGAFLVAGGLVERAAVLESPNVNMFRDVLFAFGCILFSMAIFSWMHGRRQFVIGRIEQVPTAEAKSPRSQEAFLPLASQDEIHRSDEAERTRRRRSKLSFAAGLLENAASPTKNPR